jgi:3-deoxy-D-manno-octulosonic-acid transferase
VITPRHPERFDEVAQLLNASGLEWQRRSELTSSAHATSSARILLIDTVGELGGWWGLSQIAFVGGSMGTRGGQNMVEPAAYGAAVCFGPNTHNFRDIVRMLLEREAAIVVHDGAELSAFVQRCLDVSAFRRTLGTRARQLVLEQKGAADRTLRVIESRCGLESVLPAKNAG